MLAALKSWARNLKRDVVALWIAARDRRTPMAARVLAALVAGYALSPIDLIPDVIPILGYVDDLLIVPLGLWLVLRMIPAALLAEFRERASAQARPRSLIAAVFIVLLWLGAAAVVGAVIWSRLNNR